MTYAYLDESGCLGFNPINRDTTKHFIITVLCVEKTKPLEIIVKKTFDAMPQRARRAHSGVLHCREEKPKSRKCLLRLLGTTPNVSIMTIRINKTKTRAYRRFLDNQQALYTYMVTSLFDRVFTKNLLPMSQPIQFIASQRETNTAYNQKFCQDIYEHNKQQHGIKLRPVVKTPSQDKGLQVVDSVSWALFRYHEYGDNEYYDLIKPMIVEDDIL